MAAGMNLNQAMKADASNKEIEEAMKRVREAQSLISAAIEPGSEYWSLTSLPMASSELLNMRHSEARPASALTMEAMRLVVTPGVRFLPVVPCSMSFPLPPTFLSSLSCP